MANFRNKKLQEDIKRDVMYIIANKLKNPLLKTMIVITAVELTNDLSYAKIYVRTNNNDHLIEELEQSSKFIKKELSQKMTTRITPELIFKKDESLEYGAKIEQILADLKKGNK